MKITQRQMAEVCECTHQRISDIESLKYYPTPQQKTRMAKALKCDPAELIFRPQPTHKAQPMETHELVRTFRHKPFYRPPREKTGESRLATLRLYYANSMRELEPLLVDSTIRQFVDDAPFDSGLETLKWLKRVSEERARPAEVAPTYLGFDLHPVVNRKTRRVVGHCPVPALVTERWMAILQVSVLTPTLYTMDALVCVIHKGVRYFFALEIEGPGKPPPDPRRDKALAMRVIRFTKDEILRGVGIGDKLDEIFGD